MAAQDIPVELFSAGLWPQQDARDPLGVWAARHIATGSVGGGPIKVQFQPGADKAGAYLYTCYIATMAQLSADEDTTYKCRLLTNWPDADDDAGVQGVSTLTVVASGSAGVFTPPFGGPLTPLLEPQWRYALLFDPRPVAGAFTIVELEQATSVDTQQYAFEAWGYYWDRQVMQTPGGPRHPGAN